DPELGSLAVFEAERDLEAASGLAPAGIEVEVGGRGAGSALDGRAEGGAGALVVPLVATQALHGGEGDGVVRGQARQRDVDVLHAVAAGSRRLAHQVVAILPAPAALGG